MQDAAIPQPVGTSPARVPSSQKTFENIAALESALHRIGESLGGLYELLGVSPGMTEASGEPQPGRPVEYSSIFDNINGRVMDATRQANVIETALLHLKGELKCQPPKRF